MFGKKKKKKKKLVLLLVTSLVPHMHSHNSVTVSGIFTGMEKKTQEKQEKARHHVLLVEKSRRDFNEATEICSAESRAPFPGYSFTLKVRSLKSDLIYMVILGILCIEIYLTLLIVKNIIL